MRTLLALLFLLVFFTISIPLYLLEFILYKINPRLSARSSQAIVVKAMRILLFLCGVKKTVIGAENIPKDQSVLYVFNHRSYFDILVGYTSVPNLSCYVAKKEIARVPFLSWWMYFLNCLFLDRDNIREGLKTILKGVELIKKGYSVFIAPEGTRNHKPEMLPFKEGSLKIAEKTGCAIIPVSINNTDNIFENHMPWIKRAHVIIEFGKPIYPNDLDKEKRKFLGAYVQGIIRETLDRNARLVEF
ncbi:MAG: 1-acyl-sn-glycerol-3-phosphate acyltransferase [Lachnoclostridium sp.]|jgi:1-acyl-sn-glycerol-3-phosphate acyltransferase